PPFLPSVISRSTIGRKSLALGSVVRICSCLMRAAARFSNIAFLWAEVRLKPRWLIRWRMTLSPEPLSNPETVIPGLDPGIHVDGRVKAGHDEKRKDDQTLI